jgi:hypothetical protein
MEKPTIKQVAWVFKILREQMSEPSSFRYLIYDRMGFGPEAYEELYRAGGMEISNMCLDHFESEVNYDKV